MLNRETFSCRIFFLQTKTQTFSFPSVRKFPFFYSQESDTLFQLQHKNPLRVQLFGRSRFSLFACRLILDTLLSRHQTGLSSVPIAPLSSTDASHRVISGRWGTERQSSCFQDLWKPEQIKNVKKKKKTLGCSRDKWKNWHQGRSWNRLLNH